jgi:hypothetical protein
MLLVLISPRNAPLLLHGRCVPRLWHKGARSLAPTRREPRQSRRVLHVMKSCLVTLHDSNIPATTRRRRADAPPGTADVLHHLECIRVRLATGRSVIVLQAALHYTEHP